MKKISRTEDRAAILAAIANIMSGNGLPHGVDPVEWAVDQLEALWETRPTAKAFQKYMKDHWYKKAGMWSIGARNIQHAGQNTNAAIESYHANLKSILFSSKQRLIG